jgi:hypothetical protein
MGVLLIVKRDLNHLPGFILRRFELPFSNRVQRGVRQHRISTQHARRFDGSVGSHDCLDPHNTAYVHFCRQVGIDRFYARRDFPFGNEAEGGVCPTIGRASARSSAAARIVTLTRIPFLPAFDSISA